MSEAWTIALLIFLFTLFLTTIQTWSTFKAADKNKEARNTLAIGVFCCVIYSFFLLFLTGIFTVSKIGEILFTSVQVIYVIVWTIGIILIPKTVSFLVNKITSIGTTYAKGKNKLLKPPSKNKSKIVFSDELKTDFNKWRIVCGSPQISSIRGLPNPPSLLLEENSTDRRDSFIIAKGISIKNGAISCDVYLEREAVINIIFRCNINNFYMARIDSRSAGSSGILLSKDKIGNWSYINQPNEMNPTFCTSYLSLFSS